MTANQPGLDVEKETKVKTASTELHVEKETKVETASNNHTFQERDISAQPQQQEERISFGAKPGTSVATSISVDTEKTEEARAPISADIKEAIKILESSVKGQDINTISQQDVDKFFKNGGYDQSLELNPAVVKMFAELQQICRNKGMKIRAGGVGEKNGEMAIYLKTNMGPIMVSYEVSHLDENGKLQLINQAFKNIADARETIQRLVQPSLKKSFKECLLANPNTRKILNGVLLDFQQDPPTANFWGERGTAAAIVVSSGAIPLSTINIADVAQAAHEKDLINAMAKQTSNYLTEEIEMAKISSKA